MKEAFEVMGEHWMVTLWLGIVLMGCCACLANIGPLIKIGKNG